MNNNTKNDIYYINKYTDVELYNILDIVNPTDRELEARILFLIHKYENMQNKSGDELANFFTNIYNHFFETGDEDGDEIIIEGMENNGANYIYSGKDDPESIIINGNTRLFADENIENATKTLAKLAEVRSNVFLNPSKYYNAPTGNTIKYGEESAPYVKQVAQIVDTASNYRKDDVGFMKPLDYAQDKLNPLLQQTVKRIISIDSQYRDDKKTYSTEFTFNLSEPVKDVVSLKLYSIQIPYTWYTINNNFGSNFIYLKGDVPGIDDGEYDYKIEILPGNYSPSNLIKTINDSFKTIMSNNPDVSFGTTNISYNDNTSRATFNIDIYKLFTETSYYLEFPTWSNPNNEEKINGITNYYRKESIPGFLGFNLQTYYPNILLSDYLEKISTTSIINDTTIGNYIVDNSNNYFTIIKYIDPNEYTEGTSVVDLSFHITLSNSGLLTRNSIIEDLSYQLASNNYLTNSSIIRYNIIDGSSNNPTLKGVDKSQFKLTLKYNRLTTNNIEYSKILVKFPDETNNKTSIWTGSSSCFGFKNIINELNNIIAETSPIKQVDTKTVISSDPYIYLKCNLPGYISTSDMSLNDYKIDISNSNTIGYTLTEHITAINNSIINTNEKTKGNTNTTGDYNMVNTNAYLDNNTIFNLKLDINKNFTNSMYKIDISNTILSELLQLDNNNIYLNGTTELLYSDNNKIVFSSQFSERGGGYTISNTNLLKVYNSDKYGNKYSGNLIVDSSSNSYSSIGSLQEGINNIFANYTDSNGFNVLKNTRVDLKFNSQNTSKIDCSFTINIQKTITQNDYNIYFYDSSANTGTNGILDKYDDGTWSELNIDQSFCKIIDFSNGYPLKDFNINNSTSYTILTCNDAIETNLINFTNNVNNYFYIKPYENGVTTSTGYNDIQIKIPVLDTGGSIIKYSRDTLISTINSLLEENALTYGSTIIVESIDNIEYLRFRINIKKIYRAVDFRLVFYDQESFIKCYLGSAVRNTTWDATLGWILGFRESTIYNLSDTLYSYDNTSTHTITLIGDTTVSVNLFNYFLLCLDDYNQNHLNDGLVTLTSRDTEVSIPSYAIRSNYTCDPATGLLVYGTNTTNPVTNSKLTQNQIYALTETANSKRSSSIISNADISAKGFGSGPFVKDVFGLIPIKTAGLANGAVYVDYGGTLQNQERSYFGPVNIHRMSIKLVTDRGDLLDLNGSNWSFSLICEQLYQKKPTSSVSTKN